MSFSLDVDELINIDGIPRENLTFKINIDDLQVDWDDELGSGSFAQVFRGFYLWTEVAIKKMILPIEESEKGLIKYFKREVILLNILKHPNIVQFLGWCHPEDSNYILLVEEYIKGGTLHNYICKKTSKQMWGTKILLCSDVAKAMLYLHKNNIVYRDLKCDNILVDDSTNPRFAKLVDFGFARTLEMEHKRKGPPLTICGTDDWMAPEVIMGVDYDERSDVFSFGVVLLECILGTDVIQKQLQRVANNCFELNMELTRKLTPASCPEELIELTLSCCAYDPNARPDFNEILTGLTNTFRHLDDSIAVVSDVSAENSPIVSQRNSKTTHSRQRSGSGAIELSRMIPSDDDDDSSDSPKSSSPLNPSRSPGSTLRKSTLMTQSSPNLVPRSPHTSHEKTQQTHATTQATQQTHATSHASTQETHRHSFSSADDEADDLRRRVSQNSIRALSGSPRAVAFTMDQMPSELRLSSTSVGDEKKEYIRVESLVDAHVWNVRVGPGATVADVCELLLKKIDAKYKFIELFQIHKKKKVSLFPEQFIDNIRSRWDGDLNYKFGIEYHSISTGKDWGNSLSKHSTIGKAFKKETYGRKNSKKKAMAVNFNMSPLDGM